MGWKKTRKHIKLALQTTLVELFLERTKNGKFSIRIIELFRFREVQPTYTWSQNVWNMIAMETRPNGLKKNAQTYQISATDHLSRTVSRTDQERQIFDSNNRVISFQRSAAHLYVVTKCLKYDYDGNATEWVEKKTRKHIKLALQTTLVELVLERAENGKS